VSFSNDSYLMDEIMGHIFSLNISKVPLLREASVNNIGKVAIITLNGMAVDIEELKALKVKVLLAPGWINYDN
jgi:hypothetical protein